MSLKLNVSGIPANANCIFEFLGNVVDAFVGGSRHDRELGIQNRQFGENWRNQERFAKESLGWKIEDAGRYGISPLAAIGSITGQGNPSPVTGTSVHGGSRLGQGLGRFLDRKIRKEEARIALKHADTAEKEGQARIRESDRRAELMQAQKELMEYRRYKEQYGIDNNNVPGIEDAEALGPVDKFSRKKMTRKETVNYVSEWATTMDRRYVFPVLKGEYADAEVFTDRWVKAMAAVHPYLNKIKPPSSYLMDNHVWHWNTTYHCWEQLRKGSRPHTYEMERRPRGRTTPEHKKWIMKRKSKKILRHKGVYIPGRSHWPINK